MKVWQGLLAEQGSRAVNQGFDDQLNNILTTTARTGDSTAAGSILAESSRERGEALKDALVSAKLQGLSQFENLEGQRTQRFGNTALAFNQSAGQLGGARLPSEALGGASTNIGNAPNITAGIEGVSAGQGGLANAALQGATQGTQGAANTLVNATQAAGGSTLGDIFTGIGGFADIFANQQTQDLFGGRQTGNQTSTPFSTANTPFNGASR